MRSPGLLGVGAQDSVTMAWQFGVVNTAVNTQQNHDSMPPIAKFMQYFRPIGLFSLMATNACGDDLPVPPLAENLPPLPETSAPAELPRGPEHAPREMVIALVGEVRGEIEPCGCPTLPFGGFVRRQVLLERLTQDGLPLFHLDAGETLLKGVATARSDASADRAQLILDLSSDVGVDAWSPGPTDLLALGAEGLRLEGGPAAVSASWRVGGEALLPPSRVLEEDGVRVGVVGVSGAPIGRRDRDQVEALGAVEAARAGVAHLPEDIDLVVVLGHMPQADADAIATQVEGVDLVLTTRDREVDDPRTPTRADGTPGAMIVETSDRGRYLHLVQLRLGSDRGEPLQLVPERSAWRELSTARDQVRNARAAEGERLPELEEQLAAVESQFEEAGRGRNLVDVSVVPLGVDLDGAEAVHESIEAFKDRTLKRAAVQAVAPPPPHVAGYASSGGCVTCHAPEFARWGFSDHAKAWTSLLRRGASDNPECVGCHSTGFGQPGGFGELTPANVRKFKAVQCEACHGPLLGHPDVDTVKARPITPQVCLGCHDPANSPDFDFPSYIARASCQSVERNPAPAPATP
jgi:hypothetical protein